MSLSTIANQAVRAMGCKRSTFSKDVKLIQDILEKMTGDAYGRGVTAGKMEALKYTPEERERYGRWTGDAPDCQNY